jgi:hypothetical protein
MQDLLTILAHLLVLLVLPDMEFHRFHFPWRFAGAHIHYHPGSKYTPDLHLVAAQPVASLHSIDLLAAKGIR